MLSKSAHEESENNSRNLEDDLLKSDKNYEIKRLKNVIVQITQGNLEVQKMGKTFREEGHDVFF